MHHCLSTYDILCIILDFFDVGESKEDKRTVIAFAYTCRAFGSPAFDRLWYHLTSLRPLLKCLPGDSWEEKILVAGEYEGGEGGMYKGTKMVSNLNFCYAS
jgi:hypothetical protein